MKDSSGHFNGAVFLYRLQFVCCEVIYFRKEAAGINRKLTSGNREGRNQNGRLGGQSSTSDFGEELQK
ncbi:hypothetical protein AAHB36_13290 [Bacillus velezensis]